MSMLAAGLGWPGPGAIPGLSQLNKVLSARGTAAVNSNPRPVDVADTVQ